MSVDDHIAAAVAVRVLGVRRGEPKQASDQVAELAAATHRTAELTSTSAADGDSPSPSAVLAVGV